MANYKGSSIVLLRKLFTSKSISLLSRFLESLSPEERKIYEFCLSSDWIPLSIAQGILEKTAKTFYPGQPNAFQQIGSDRAKIHLTGIYRPMLSILKPSFIISQSAKVWKTYYDTGTARHEIDNKAKKASMFVEGFPELPELFREISSGYMTAAVAMTGAKNITLHRDDSNPLSWRWDGSWE